MFSCRKKLIPGKKLEKRYLSWDDTLSAAKKKRTSRLGGQLETKEGLSWVLSKKEARFRIEKKREKPDFDGDPRKGRRKFGRLAGLAPKQGLANSTGWCQLF